jgi:hypothetical protein
MTKSLILRAVSLAVSLTVSTALLGGCGSNAAKQPGADLGGRWVGNYVWESGATYEVKLDIDPASITGTDIVTFRGVEDAGSCPNVAINGTLETRTNIIRLDEVSAKGCESFILGGLFEGTWNRETNQMDLTWSFDDEDASDSQTGRMILSRTGVVEDTTGSTPETTVS